MLKVNNKKVIQDLAKTTYKANKKRNLLTIVAIFLTTFLLCTVISIGLSYWDTVSLRQQRIQGIDYDIELTEPRDDQVSTIRKMDSVKYAGLNVKCGIVSKYQDKELDKLKLYWLDDTCWKQQTIPALDYYKGSYPTKIVEFARRTLFLTDSETNWQACIWYMDRFQFDKSRINASSPVKSLSFINIYEKENRWYLQLYAKYLVGISDLSLSNIRNTISFISQFLKYLDGQSKKVTELEMQDIADYVSVLDESDIKYSTFNRYITHMHTFLQFLKMKNIEVLKFYPERFLKKGFSEHNERSVPEKTIAHLIKELPAFPEHLQLMYLILFCTGIRKSEVCTIKSGAFYSQDNDNWMRIYQSKMRREKVIPVPSLLVGLVNDYEKKYGIKNGEYLFKNKKGGAFNGQTFSNQMIRECKARGIACGDYIFRAHDYRHNLATSMYGNGVSIQGVRDYLGHSSENMTKQYIDFMPERIVSAEDKYFSKNQSFKLKGAEDDER